MYNVHRLMLVDDDEDDREIFLSVIQNILPEATYTIAINGEDALAKLNSSPVDPHLIFLDLNMPLMNGKQFLMVRRDNKRLNSIPVIMLSTSNDQKTIKEATELGALFFVTKPNKYVAWEDALRNILMTFYFDNNS
jgi:CheY-like chemotaxis protein